MKNDSVNIVLLHGGTGMDDSYFYPYCSELGSNVFSYKQGSLIESNSIEDLLAELDQFVISKKITNFVLIGHSFGGALALEYYKKFPTKTIGIILVSAVFDHLWSEVYSCLTPKDEPSFNYPENGFSNADYLDECIFYANKYFSSENVELGKSILSKIEFDAKLRIKIESKYMKDFDCKDLIEKMEIPILNIYGLNDKVVFPKYSQSINALNEKIKTVCFHNSAHYPFAEEPELFNITVNDYLREVTNEKTI